ncbi:GspE/PulE family protein [Campylobacter sp. IFREMER_LSEM_CL2101]|uniref:GspE/PulE family protein n=1 Tax=Campylobacter sp. IFREMER_LSEM_CL2101 TaxID=2911618 RepID=UPI0021E70B78|nr:GspE/PulE family protein [Campylobacter sp. IFREMER_LSEM_CL2101]MCV3391621.1 GspE/PulE family protein [Campylobacter sp. IFREMER_LSEM_CL2101]
MNDTKEIKALNELSLQELALEYKLEILDLNQTLKIEKYIHVLPFSLIEQYNIFCFYEDDENIHIASLKPLDESILEKIQNLYRLKVIKIFLCDFTQFKFLLERIKFLICFQNYLDKLELNLKSDENKDEFLLEQFLNLILTYACFLRASDIHLEPLENEILIRFRIDGELKYIHSFDVDSYQALLMHIKIITLLNVAEQRQAQDGSFSKIILEQKYDFRISIMPLLFGQSVVLRILKQDEYVLKLDRLFIKEENLTSLKKYMNAPYGLILFCGPTGSGKSTFMHAILNELDQNKKIITLEDPIEYKLKHAQQILLNSKIGFDFHKALRAVLRQDPDVIMVGEIRDDESLDIVLKASLSGHLVLSTLHTNGAIEAIFRMKHMGAKEYLIAYALNLIIAQRLVRKLCECKELSNEKFHFQNQVFEGKFYKAKGCAKCMHSGYKGRLMVAEFLFLDHNLKSMIENNANYENILTYALKKGFLTLGRDALEKVKLGLTSVDELRKIGV